MQPDADSHRNYIASLNNLTPVPVPVEFITIFATAEDVATVITVIATIISDAAETCDKRMDSRSGESQQDDTYSNTTRCCVFT